MAIGWNDASEIVVAGTGQVYVATTGTALPTTATATLNAAFSGLGYHTEDGVTVTATPTVEEFMAWQSRQAVRRSFTAQEITIAFSLMQWNEETVPLAFGGGSVVSDGGTGYRYSFPDDDDALLEKAVVVDCIDGTEHHRFVFSRATVTEAVEAQFTRSTVAELPITLKVLAPESGGSPGDYYTDSAAFAAGS